MCGSGHSDFSLRGLVKDDRLNGLSIAGHDCVENLSQKYQRRPNAPHCASYMRTGVCKAVSDFGCCSFDHPPPCDTPAKERRCKVCTLKLPCRAHFPEFGAALHKEDFSIIEPICNRETALPKYEIVAVIPPRCTVDDAIYAYIIEDNLGFNTTTVAYSAKGFERCPTLERSKIFTLRGFKTHHKEI